LLAPDRIAASAIASLPFINILAIKYYRFLLIASIRVEAENRAVGLN
jgi:hypothetical protein